MEKQWHINPNGQDLETCKTESLHNTAQDIIKYGVITVTPNTPVYIALSSMVDRNITGLPVVNDYMELEGIITEKDLLVLLYQKQSTRGNVDEYMSRNVVNFDLDTPLLDICQCLENHSFRRVPITEKGRVISVLSRTDLLRDNVHRFASESMVEFAVNKEPIFPAWQMMNKGLITVTPKASLFEGVLAMTNYHISGLPIVEDNMKMVGILSEKDVMPYFYRDEKPPVLVEELMTTEIISFSPEDSLFEITECLINHSFRRVPIVENGKLVGLVSRADVIRYILRNMSQVIRKKNEKKVTV